MFLATAQSLIGVYSDKNVPTAVEQMPICQLFSGLLPGGQFICFGPKLMKTLSNTGLARLHLETCRGGRIFDHAVELHSYIYGNATAQVIKNSIM